MFKAAIPLVHVASSQEAMDFYRDRLGFAVRSTYRLDASRDDPAYHVMVRDEAILHVSSFSGDGVAGGVVNFVVTDIEQLHDDLVRRGVDVGAGVMDQTWGTREVYVRDPSGNKIRFQAAPQATSTR